MKKFAALTLAVLMAIPASAASVTISGYIDVGFIAAENGLGAGGAGAGGAGALGAASGATNGTIVDDDGFSLNEVNIDIMGQLTNDISAFISMDWTPNGGLPITGAGNGADVTVDYAYVDIANPGPFDLNVRAGRIPSVIGIGQRMSESPQTKFINLSLVSPYTVGSLDGVAVYGSFSPINYAFSVTNDDLRGLNELDAGATAVGVAGVAPGNNNGTAGVAGLNNNNNWAISGRIGVVPIEGLEVGVSGATSKYAAGGTTPPQPDLERNTYGFDASYSFGAWNFKGEYVNVSEDDFDANRIDNDLSAWYLEAMYDLSSKYSIGVRYNEAQMDASNRGAAYEVNSIQIAGVYRVADNVHVKAEYAVNDEDIRNFTSISPEIGNDVLAFSLVGAF